ncbi:RNA polymerase sigma factor [Agromyces sp. NPDC057865]|uniref:RNA polymerase sigma factor n=1 Tax=Agromyces sp. NPDC057865 TaxID=3346267 RepID=UPI00366EB528
MSDAVGDAVRALRAAAPSALAVLVRRYGDFETCEDAMQEALIAASAQWPRDGVPDSPRAWLVQVASRRYIDQVRSDAARRRRESLAVDLEPPPTPVPAVDDTLALFLLCCHPALTTPSQIALTLRAVGGLTTAEIARSLLVPEATIAQRISRAKARIKASDEGFRMPRADELESRLGALRSVLYLVFTEGHTASSGDRLARVDLSAEAIRLTRQLHDADPDASGETTGLLALMLLTDARRAARTDDAGAIVPLDEQDRSRWDRAMIDEGVALVTAVLDRAPIGPYQLQAAIAAVHDEADSTATTDWLEILGLYDLLACLAPSPMVTLGRIVALAMVQGPDAGLAALDRAEAQRDDGLTDHHRTWAVRAHLLEQSGSTDAASLAFAEAARRTLNGPEQRYLATKAERLRSSAG